MITDSHTAEESFITKRREHPATNLVGKIDDSLNTVGISYA